jgi:hypothetical protein
MVIDQNGKHLNEVWHAADFRVWVNRLNDFSRTNTGQSETYYDLVHSALNAYVDKAPDGWIKSSFIPGKDWTGTPYDPLYLCLGTAFDYDQWNDARLFFGLFVCQVLIERDEEWNVFAKAEKEDGTIYHRTSD